MQTGRELARSGFTLIELAVSLLIGAILITALFQTMSGQARISAAQSGREETQQNTRGALEIMSAELRSAVPAAVLEATAQSVEFMQPRAWGLLCGNAGPSVINVVVPDVGADAAWAANPVNGVLVQTGPGVFAPSPALGRAARAYILNSQEVAMATCGLNSAGNVKVVQVSLSQPVTGVAGSAVALYTLTRYDVAATDGVLWLRRNSGIDDNHVYTPQPLAGPLADDRFSLEFRDGAGAIIGTPVAAANLQNIRQVRIRVVTESTQRLNGTAQRDSGETVVTLRNVN